ncbi:MAG: GNAT family N-acetyltransferase [Brachybacterium sp.]|uniref:GNAT family N-acetyltransferase n=1 Tax=Brachybacterium sp. TaxID=1891286 RepID=UPI002654A2DA|nr:N-acetyltransferase [Brachybacterium sp.]MDN6330485.1 N-acetyltransferase [Brachybacterium sp.]MDN6398958.1 N-acetyltransferase [Brachybacterium sp.]
MDEISAEPDAVRLVHNADRDRYEALDGDEVVAVLAHEDEDPPAGDGEGLGVGVRDLRSTVVAPERSGAGIGSAIVRFALDDIRSLGMRVRPTCWFVRGWIERHHEYADLLEPTGHEAKGETP